jgi:hypothetical protein
MFSSHSFVYEYIKSNGHAIEQIDSRCLRYNGVSSDVKYGVSGSPTLRTADGALYLAKIVMQIGCICV